MKQAPLIVAHRGASADAPENTLAAFKLGFEQGADAIEGDFHLTADGKLACVHDHTFLKTGGDARAVLDVTMEQARQIKVGFRDKPESWTHPIVSLDDVLAIIPDGKRFFIEIKVGPEAIPELKRAIEASKRVCEQLVVIAFDSETIAASKRAMPQVKACWLVGFAPDKRAEWLSVEAVLARAAEIGADGLDVQGNPDAIDQRFVDALRAAGKEWHVWTIDDPARAKRFAAMGVDSITTNKPRFIRDALA